MPSGDWSVFTRIMLFYILLSYLLFPAIFYFTMGKTLRQAGRGFVVGSIISLFLWQFYGSKMI